MNAGPVVPAGGFSVTMPETESFQLNVQLVEQRTVWIR